MVKIFCTGYQTLDAAVPASSKILSRVRYFHMWDIYVFELTEWRNPVTLCHQVCACNFPIFFHPVIEIYEITQCVYKLKLRKNECKIFSLLNLLQVLSPFYLKWKTKKVVRYVHKEDVQTLIVMYSKGLHDIEFPSKKSFRCISLYDEIKCWCHV